MSEISNSNREAERQRIEQMEREQRKAEEDRIQQERENSKELQAEEFSLSEDKDVAEDIIVESVAESSVSFDSLENEVFPDDYYVEDTEFLDSFKDSGEESELSAGIRQYLGKEELTETEKEDISNKTLVYKEKVGGDVLAYEKNAIGRVEEDQESRECYVTRHWPRDGVKEGTEHTEVVQTGSIIDRYGSPSGAWASPLKEDGTPFSITERAIGVRPIGPNIEDDPAYHRYEVNQDLNKDNLQRVLDEYYPGAKDRISYSDDGSVQISADDLDAVDYYLSKTELDKYYDDPTKQQYYEESSDGIRTSIANRMFGTENNPDGGATQHEFPWSIKELETYGLITEIRDYD